MNNSRWQLLKLAHKFQNKYGQAQTLQQIIENAASYGQDSNNGIMNFPKQLRDDNADLSITITLDGNTATVGNPTVDPQDKSPNYQNLPGQIKTYLKRNRRWFTQLADGTTTLKYSGKSGIAQHP
jgi:hypothetical protein